MFDSQILERKTIPTSSLKGESKKGNGRGRQIMRADSRPFFSFVISHYLLSAFERDFSWNYAVLSMFELRFCIFDLVGLFSDEGSVCTITIFIAKQQVTPG